MCASVLMYSGATVPLSHLVALRFAAKQLHVIQTLARVSRLSGQAASRSQGRGIDFVGVRAYQAGDEIRRMDWRATARTGKPHTKVYEVEKQRTVAVVVDCSASLFFGTRVAFKSVIAAQVAALLAWQVQQSGSQLIPIIYSGAWFEQSQNLGCFLKTLSDTVVPISDQPIDYRQLFQTTRRADYVIVISDFNQIPCSTDFIMQQKYHAIALSDPLERTLSENYRYQFTEDGQTVLCQGKAMINVYKKQFKTNRKKLEVLLKQCHIPLLSLSTDDAIWSLLKAYFKTC